MYKCKFIVDQIVKIYKYIYIFCFKLLAYFCSKDILKINILGVLYCVIYIFQPLIRMDLFFIDMIIMLRCSFFIFVLTITQDIIYLVIGQCTCMCEKMAIGSVSFFILYKIIIKKCFTLYVIHVLFIFIILGQGHRLSPFPYALRLFIPYRTCSKW